MVPRGGGCGKRACGAVVGGSEGVGSPFPPASQAAHGDMHVVFSPYDFLQVVYYVLLGEDAMVSNASRRTKQKGSSRFPFRFLVLQRFIKRKTASWLSFILRLL